jgi:hypothetical protein
MKGTYGSAEEDNQVIAVIDGSYQITRHTLRCLLPSAPSLEPCLTAFCSLLTSRDEEIVILSNMDRKKVFLMFYRMT